jgi:hypothetical protein
MACNDLQYVEICEEGREIYGINDKTIVSVLVVNAWKIMGVAMKLNFICCH